MLVWIAARGARSHSPTCLSAAVWITMSTASIMAVRQLTSPMSARVSETLLYAANSCSRKKTALSLLSIPITARGSCATSWARISRPTVPAAPVSRTALSRQKSSMTSGCATSRPLQADNLTERQYDDVQVQPNRVVADIIVVIVEFLDLFGER